MEVLASRLILHPSDMAQSRQFYEQVLGLRIFHEYGNGRAVVGVVYFLGGGFLELSGATPGRANGFSTLWLQVPDVSREETCLRGLGVPLGGASLSQGLGADRTAFGRSGWPCGDPGRSSGGPFPAASAVAQVSCRAGPHLADDCALTSKPRSATIYSAH
jgi:catechol 2,3-dioxygenase-like lactoylglutathione lyase family enzyme